MEGKNLLKSFQQKKNELKYFFLLQHLSWTKVIYRFFYTFDLGKPFIPKKNKSNLEFFKIGEVQWQAISDFKPLILLLDLRVVKFK